MTPIQTVVSPQWLRDNLQSPQLKIIDCRFRLEDSLWGYQQYLTSHIPNAYYLDLNKDLSSPPQTHGGRHPLPNPYTLAQKLEQIGIFKNLTTVVVYDDSRFAFASRLWWLLRYLGHDKVFILDGGWQQWQSLHYPVTSDIPPPSQGHFPVTVDSSQVVDIHYVKQRLNFPNTVIVDARSPSRYRGEEEPIDPVAGSIPGAKNIFWQQITTPDGFLRPTEELQALWQPYLDAQEIVVYCGSGVTACVDLMSLATIGFHHGKLYPGGWSDWCSYLDYST